MAPGTSTAAWQVTSNRVGTAALVAAAILVGLATAADGTLAWAMNGIGGVLWISAVAIIAWSLRRSQRGRVGIVVTLACALVLAVFVRPSDALLAVAGFATAGGVTAVIVGNHGSLWARFVPAIWLPAHLIVAVGGAIGRDLGGAEPLIRTEPPPTAAIVPLVMVLAAWTGGEAVVHLRERRNSSSHQPRAALHARSHRGTLPGREEGTR